MKYPTISVVTPTYNSAKTLRSCLTSIRKQNYPQNKIEIIIIDGGSRDKTKEIAKEFRTKWISVDPKKQNVEYNKSTGIQKAKGDLLFMVDHDNILQSKSLLKKMVQPFLDIPDMVGVETYRYHYSRELTLLDRYFALFGVTDPLAYYLGKADRMSYITDGYSKKFQPLDVGKYYVVRFKKDHIPTIGANGFLIKRDLLIKHAKTKPGKYFPIDVNVDLIKKGYNTYAFTKDSLTHIAGHGSPIYYLQRRMLFVKQYYLGQKNSKLRKDRRYSVYEEKDFWGLIIFITISLTIVKPLLDSTRGYLKVRDVAWFLHPIMCFSFVIMYSYVILEHKVNLVLK